mgnify:CR=1 FL=1
MTHDVSHWLAEIRTLQRQLADTCKERDQAFASAANWRRLYETEARQRRHEIQALRSQTLSNEHDPSKPPVEEAKALSETQVEPLQARLEDALQRCRELSSQLEAEKQAHAHTRKTLTTALGEAFDTLKPNTDKSVTPQGN